MPLLITYVSCHPRDRSAGLRRLPGEAFGKRTGKRIQTSHPYHRQLLARTNGRVWSLHTPNHCRGLSCTRVVNQAMGFRFACW